MDATYPRTPSSPPPREYAPMFCTPPRKVQHVPAKKADPHETRIIAKELEDDMMNVNVSSNKKYENVDGLNALVEAAEVHEQRNEQMNERSKDPHLMLAFVNRALIQKDQNTHHVDVNKFIYVDTRNVIRKEQMNKGGSIRARWHLKDGNVINIYHFSCRRSNLNKMCKSCLSSKKSKCKLGLYHPQINTYIKRIDAMPNM